MKLSNEQKNAISNALNDYLEQHKMSANELVKRTGVNERYIGAIKQGLSKSGEVLISDKWYRLIAESINFSLKREYWKIIPTPQMLRMLDTLQDAKNHNMTVVIIGETGCGKTYTADLFKKKFPFDTYKITVGSLDTINDLLDKILDSMKILMPKTKSMKIRIITNFLKKKQLSGEKPILIFDECEFMKQPALCSMKELYDGLSEYAGLVMIGTNQLLENLDRMKKKNRPGIPQFFRRIKFGIRELNPINKNYKEFLENIEDKELKNWLKQNCENYGELHDVLVPARRESERTGESLSYELVCKILALR